MTHFPEPQGPIREVSTGMTVIDSEGETVGTVGRVHLVDSDTASGEGPKTEASGDPFGWVPGTFDIDTGMRELDQERLARLGYVRVDASGVLSGHRYVEADQIASVTGDEVRLSVPAGQLLGFG